MTNNVVIALSCGTNDTNRATRAIHLATIARMASAAEFINLSCDAAVISL